MYEVSSSSDSGRVIAFWSPIHRQGATSSTAAMVACLMAEELEEGEKILIMSNEIYGAPTAGTYMQRDNMPDGLTEVVELSNSENLKGSEDIYNNTFSCFGDKIDILSCRKKSNNLANDLPRAIPNIFETARNGYKYTIVDVVAGTSDESTMAILRNCDTLVVCMPQDRYVFDNWIRKTQGIYTKEAENKRTTVVVTMYYNYKHMNYHSMLRQLKKELYHISLNDYVHKAVCERDMIGAMKSTLHSKHPDDVIVELQAIIQNIKDNLKEVINDELLRDKEEEEVARQNTQEYLESLDLFSYDEEDGEEFTSSYTDFGDDSGFGAPEEDSGFGAPEEDEQKEDVPSKISFDKKDSEVDTEELDNTSSADSSFDETGFGFGFGEEEEGDNK